MKAAHLAIGSLVAVMAATLTGSSTPSTSFVSGHVSTSRLSASVAARGATVTVYEFPDLMGLKPGQSRALTLIGRTTTDARGDYSLTAVHPATAGWVNTEVVVTTASGAVSSTAVARRWDGHAWTSSTGPATLNTVVPLSATGKGIDGQVKPEIGPDPPCEWQDHQNIANWTTILEFHNSKNSTGDWRYGRTADSSIGAAANIGGSWAGGQGSVEVSNSRTNAVGVNPINGHFGRYAQTVMDYQRGQVLPGYCGQPEQIRAVGWEGDGERWIGDSSGATCSNGNRRYHTRSYSKNGFFTTQGAHAADFSAGATFGGSATGGNSVSVTATSGYSNDVSLHWTWKAAGVMCGTNAVPANADIVYTSP